MSSTLKTTCGLLSCWLGLLFLCLHPAGKLQAFAIFPPNHQLVTQQALGNCCFEYTMPNGAKVSFSTEAIDKVSFGNLNIDLLSLKDEQLAEDFHFDDERFDFGQFVLLYTRDLVVVQLQDEAFAQSDPQSLLRQQMLTRTSREMLGNALHTLQDYYAHTNWVERGLQNGNLAINPVLGAKGKSLHGPSAQTCDENAPGSTQLTSGYYLATGVFDCASICNAPANECAHGNIACPGLDCGINKDVSPREHYAEAFDLATQHTALFVRQIFDEALSANPAVKNRVAIAICQFMGVPDPGTNCVTRYSLTVQKANQVGGGTTSQGLVQSASGNIIPAINCGPLCEVTAVAGTEVQLTASDTPPWIFVRWGQGGACAGSNSRTCTVTLNSNQTARAVFEEKLPIPLTSYSTSHSCYFEIYARQYSCDGVGESDSGFVTYHGELGADYGGTPQSGGGIANIRAEGQVNVQPGHSSIRTVLEGEATGQWFARGQQSAGGSYSATVIVTSDTLPVGTPVTVRVSFHLSSQRSLSVELSEPPIVQWGVAPFQLKAYLGANGYQSVVSLDGGNATNESVDIMVQTQVGSGINISAGLQVLFQWMELSRATVREEINASVNGPYLTETGGLNVQFIQN